jgi:hypothetical protein
MACCREGREENDCREENATEHGLRVRRSANGELTRMGQFLLHTTSGDTVTERDDDRPPICPRCGVTMVPAALSADDTREGDWVCLECEELADDEQ